MELIALSQTFFHPDYTVGPGVHLRRTTLAAGVTGSCSSPNGNSLVGYTTDWELPRTNARDSPYPEGCDIQLK